MNKHIIKKSSSAFFLILLSCVLLHAQNDTTLSAATPDTIAKTGTADIQGAKMLTPQDAGIDIAPEDTVDVILKYAETLLGSKYGRSKIGGKTFDCSGYTREVYHKIGYTLGASSRDQYKQGIKVELDSLKKGDLVFWKGTRSKNIGHVGIVYEVLGDGAFRFIHATRPGRCVSIDNSTQPFYAKRYIGARRILY
ncbi:MAG TPA: C40 family peptidase [Candidatus Egerieousia sp.]|nr:C40 family peptidase [Candidatus Egerieousia sp.]HPT05977.1 C40 family peptidase [Candidatus Egerieousia sp.]